MGLLRLWLAIAVAMEHADGWFKPLDATLAVHAFYLISGFYIQLVVAGRYFPQGINHRSLGRFYASRMLRIYVPYLICLGLTLLALLAYNWIASHDTTLMADLKALNQGSPWAKIYFWASQAGIFGLDWMRFLAFDKQGGDFLWMHAQLPAFPERYVPGSSLIILPQSWSLALELCFYLIAPFILLKRTRWVAGVAAISVALRFCLPGLMHYDPFDHRWLIGFFPTELGTFLLGALACRAYMLSGKRLAAQPEMGALALLALLLYMVFYDAVGGGLGNLFYWLFLALTLASLPALFALGRNRKWDRFIGELSYPVYLLHFLVRDMLLTQAWAHNEWRNVIVVFFTLLLAAGMVWLIDLPLSRYRHRHFVTSSAKSAQALD